MATAYDLYIPTTGIIPNKLHETLKLLNLRPGLHILAQKAIILNTCCKSQNVFGRTVNKKCLVSWNCTLEKQINCYEVRKVDDDDDDNNNSISTFCVLKAHG